MKPSTDIDEIVENIIFHLEGELAVIDMLEHEAFERGEEVNLEEDYNKFIYIQTLFEERKLEEAFTLYMNLVANGIFNDKDFFEIKTLAEYLKYPMSNIDRLKRYSW